MKRAFALGLAVAAAVALAAVLGSRGEGVEEAEAAAPWTFAQSMSQRRSYIAAAELGGRIYAAGGMVGESGRHLAVFQRFDPRANSWTTLRRMPEPVRAGAGAALDEEVYVIGGSTPDGDGRQVYAFDVAAGVWRARASLPEPRLNHSAVALDGRIYVLGGFFEGEERDDVFVYEPAADTWSRATSLPRPNHAFGAVVFRDEIWVLGGRRGDKILREVWVYNPDTDQWRAGPQLPRPMELLGSAVAGEQIHAVWESTYQIYDSRTGRWAEGPRSLVTRHGLNAFHVDGALYTVGGCTTQLRDSQVVESRRIL
jgi:N-acetylneuraminic acid mutarotase